MSQACKICQKKVYPMDPQVNLDGTIFHNTCAKCEDCRAQITLANFSKTDNPDDTVTLLCKTHYLQRIKGTGGNYLGDARYKRSSGTHIKSPIKVADVSAASPGAVAPPIQNAAPAFPKVPKPAAAADESTPAPAPVPEKGEEVASPPPAVAAEPEHEYLKFGGAFLGDPKDTEDFKYVTFDKMPAFTAAHKSLMAKALTPEIFEKLKDVKSSTGYSLSNAIMTGVVTPHLGVGCTAGDEDCWEVFKDLYYPIIQGWHGYDASTQTHPMDLDASKLVFSDEQEEVFSQYVVSTRIRAARNISGFALPPGATTESRSGVEAVLMQAFNGLSDELEGTYYKLGELTEEQTNFLLERGFLFQIPSKRNLLTGAGAARSWPDNRGIFHNEAQTALCWVNEEDHCRIISMEQGGNIPSVFARFCSLSHAIKASAEANNAKLMWNEKLGFMGTCPSNLGTGLRASVMVVLPEFNKLMEGDNQEDKELLDQVCSRYDLQPRGSAGEHSAAVGGKFDISNKQRLGFSEVQLVQKMIDGVTKVIELEQLLAAGGSAADVRAKISE